MSAEVFSNKSMINIFRDDMVSMSGTVIRNESSLRLGAGSRCVFRCDFGNPLETSKLKVVYDISGGEESTRYNNNIGINLRIKMMKSEWDNESGKLVYSDGAIKTINLIPYKSTEDKGNYIDEVIDIENNLIKQLEMTLYFYSDVDTEIIEFKKFGLFNTSTVTETTVSDIVNKTVDEDYGSKLSCIDILDYDPDPATVPNGYMWINRSKLNW